MASTCRHNLASGSLHTACSTGTGCNVCQDCICANCHRCYLMHCACDICVGCDNYVHENDWYEVCDKCDELFCSCCFSEHACSENSSE